MNNCIPFINPIFSYIGISHPPSELYHPIILSSQHPNIPTSQHPNIPIPRALAPPGHWGWPTGSTSWHREADAGSLDSARW